MTSRPILETESDFAVRVGLALPQTGPLAEPAAVRAVAVGAEAAGYDGLWVGDGLLSPLDAAAPGRAGPDGAGYRVEGHGTADPLGTLAAAAACTERIRLGAGVLIAPWYPPVLLARALTTLDRMSGGRLTVGLGTAGLREEYAATGTAFTDRDDAAEECLDVLDAIWGSAVVAFEGARIRIVPSTILPKPVQPRPRILLAAYSLEELDRVARRADGWIPTGLPPSLLSPMWRHVRALARECGRRDPDRLELVVRAGIRLTPVRLGPDRPPYWGSLDQVAADLAATLEAGADEIVLQLGTSAATATELLHLAADLRERLVRASAA